MTALCESTCLPLFHTRENQEINSAALCDECTVDARVNKTTDIHLEAVVPPCVLTKYCKGKKDEGF